MYRIEILTSQGPTAPQRIARKLEQKKQILNFREVFQIRKLQGLFFKCKCD